MSRKKVYVTLEIPEAGLKLLREKFDEGMNPHDRPLCRDGLVNAASDASVLPWT